MFKCHIIQNSEHTNIVRTSSKVSTEQLVQEDPSHTAKKRDTVLKECDNFAANITGTWKSKGVLV